MIALILFLFIGQHVKTAKPAPEARKSAKVDCTYYRCNDNVIFSDDVLPGEWEAVQFKYVQPPLEPSLAPGKIVYWGVQESGTAEEHEGTFPGVVKLSDSEYSHLQELRKAVVDEEKRLALKYGAEEDCETWDRFGCIRWGTPRLGTYSYHGQFLIIEKGK